ncbi:acetoin utilization protein AcuC [Spelaeicoccus albus]|uniref:Acetoin utilization protein AcuC n=1 Tax=Spelaeicoccus albus TaxID=1280376 RepID=A0A7Z0IJG6_9MICO|nr:acetoin utilization protein AcuC [Spelaeicoccus albus]NYI69396.1 acetoin utilization protein AcuC [Spelaeicoccus albus]
MTSRPVYVVWDDVFTKYNFGPAHPMHPLRLEFTASLCREFGLFDDPAADLHTAGVANDETLLTVHSREYIDAVRAASAPGTRDAAQLRRYGLGTDDVPYFDEMHDASARIVSGTVDAASAIASGATDRAVNFCGGMHHAKSSAASGFCVYNDAAAGIRRLQAEGFTRIAYIDIDAHHGDGTEAVFWNDPGVLTISLHETGRMLFPGTGFATDVGGDGAEGQTVNIALPPRTTDAGWLRAFDACVPPLIRAFQPQVIVSQHGCDGHSRDPLTHLQLSVDAGREAALMIEGLADRYAGGRWLAVGGGGYELVDVVPRAWAHLLAIALGRPIGVAEPTPETWRAFVQARVGRTAPATMGDGADLWWRSWQVGFDPADATDRAIMGTRNAVFPLNGLDPYFD